MKGILEFNLDDSDDREEFEMAQKAWAYRLVLTDLDNELRRLYKYEDQEDIAIEEVRDMLYKLLEERNIEL